RLQISVGTGVSRDHNDSQWLDNVVDPAAQRTHYAFARLDQRTVSMSARASYTATPNLTFEFYGSPFVSSGTYSNVRELSANPLSGSYGDRFRAYAAPPGT